jgi:hypothetical protein
VLRVFSNVFFPTATRDLDSRAARYAMDDREVCTSTQSLNAPYSHSSRRGTLDSGCRWSSYWQAFSETGRVRAYAFASRCASYDDHDFALGVPFALVPEGVRDLTQAIAAADDGRDLAGFDEIL